MQPSGPNITQICFRSRRRLPPGSWAEAASGHHQAPPRHRQDAVPIPRAPRRTVRPADDASVGHGCGVRRSPSPRPRPGVGAEHLLSSMRLHGGAKWPAGRSCGRCPRHSSVAHRSWRSTARPRRSALQRSSMIALQWHVMFSTGFDEPTSRVLPCEAMAHSLGHNVLDFFPALATASSSTSGAALPYLTVSMACATPTRQQRQRPQRCSPRVAGCRTLQCPPCMRSSLECATTAPWTACASTPSTTCVAYGRRHMCSLDSFSYFCFFLGIPVRAPWHHLIPFGR